MQTPRGASVSQLHAAMTSGTPLRVFPRVEVLTSDEVPVADITGVVEDGQVSWLHGGDEGGEVTRTLTLDIADPEHALALDSDSPADGAIYADRLVKVTQRFESDDLPDGWAEVEAFTGPMVKFTRRGSRVAIEMQGKEQRARTDVAPLVCKKGMTKTAAIEKIMRERVGETRFAFPVDIADRLTADIDVGRIAEKQPWTVCQNIARGMACQLFYDGRGVLVLRRTPTASVLTLTPTGDAEPEFSHDWSQVYNRCSVRWKRGTVVVTLGKPDFYPGHPFSPSAMGRNGVPWTRTLEVDDTKIPTASRAREVARNQLRRASLQELEVRLSVVPVWHLDPLDVVALPDGTDFEWREASAQIMGGSMSVGSVESVRRPIR